MSEDNCPRGRLITQANSAAILHELGKSRSVEHKMIYDNPIEFHSIQRDKDTILVYGKDNYGHLVIEIPKEEFMALMDAGNDVLRGMKGKDRAMDLEQIITLH